MREIVIVSGGFDPIHSGHIKLIKEAAKHGEVVVLLNSDLWLQKKKGKEFLPFKERNIIMNELKNVIDVIEFDDGDTTCIEGLKKVKNKYSNSIINTNANLVITNLKQENEFLGCIRRDEHVTVLFKQKSTISDGDYLGRLVLGTEDGEIKIFGATIF